jgi:hypothetical protein
MAPGKSLGGARGGGPFFFSLGSHKGPLGGSPLGEGRAKVEGIGGVEVGEGARRRAAPNPTGWGAGGLRSRSPVNTGAGQANS